MTRRRRPDLISIPSAEAREHDEARQRQREEATSGTSGAVAEKLTPGASGTVPACS